VNNGKIEEPPLVDIPRNPLWLVVSVLISFVFVYFTAVLFRDMSPMGFLFFVPASLVAFHTLWAFLNPFAGIYKDKIELKPSLFDQKTMYFRDIAFGGLDKKGDLIIEYTDGERERFRLYGIHKAHLNTLLSALPAAK
jgi:hypothetical protein